MHHIKPEIGRWYQCRDRGQVFEVVSIDNGDGTVELQDYDGNLDEVDVRAWFTLDIEAVAAPEDWGAHADNWEDDTTAENFLDDEFIAARLSQKS